MLLEAALSRALEGAMPCLAESIAAAVRSPGDGSRAIWEQLPLQVHIKVVSKAVVHARPRPRVDCKKGGRC